MLTERNRQIKKAETNRKENDTFERGELVGEVLDGGFRHSWRAKGLCKYLKKEAAGKKSRRRNKLTLAFAVGFGKLPVLPQKLLKEMLPGVQGALSNEKAPVRRCRYEQSFALRPALSTRNSGTGYAGFLGF